MFGRSAHHRGLSGDVVVTFQNGTSILTLQPDSCSQISDSSVSRFHRIALAVGVFLFLQLIAPVTHAFTASELLLEINSERTKHGVAALQEHALLIKAAEVKSADMFAQQYFGHTSPDGVTAWGLLTSVGYDYTEAGENLALDFSDAEGVVQGWMQSPPHQKNLLDEKFQTVGLAVMDGTLNGTSARIIVAEFGRSRVPEVASTTAASVPSTPPPPSAPKKALIRTPVPPQPISQPEVLVHSLTGLPRPIPNLTFTPISPSLYAEPLSTRSPQVRGASTSIVPSYAEPSDIPSLSLITLGLSFCVVVGWAAAQKSWLQPGLTIAS